MQTFGECWLFDNLKTHSTVNGMGIPNRVNSNRFDEVRDMKRAPNQPVTEALTIFAGIYYARHTLCLFDAETATSTT